MTPKKNLMWFLAIWARKHAKPRFWVVPTPGPGRFRIAERIEVG